MTKMHLQQNANVVQRLLDISALPSLLEGSKQHEGSCFACTAPLENALESEISCYVALEHKGIEHAEVAVVLLFVVRKTERDVTRRG
jgi:hypothetical protein